MVRGRPTDSVNKEQNKIVSQKNRVKPSRTKEGLIHLEIQGSFKKQAIPDDSFARDKSGTMC